MFESRVETREEEPKLLNLTIEDYELITGDNFADNFENAPIEYTQSRFKMLCDLAKRRVQFLLENRTFEEILAEKPEDEILLKVLVSEMILMIISETQDLSNHGLASKVVEDFKLQFNTKDGQSTPFQTFLHQYQDIFNYFNGALKIRYPSNRDPQEFVI